MPTARSLTTHSARRRALVALAALAYLPLVLSHRGRLPADTKLGLTLDPLRLMSDAMRSWDTGQFAGWVPHQSVSYLWPSGPFHAGLMALGVPEWLTQRLWAGTVLFAAGTGVWWFLRGRAFSPAAAFVAAVVYQTTPFILPYISRTSLMLMPWAALGWLLALTDRATHSGSEWKRPTALFALVVGTTMGINLTAALMVAPAPVIHLLLLARQGSVRPRHALVTLVRLGLASVATSLWWLVMLLMQGRYGAEVLGYSETLEAVSSTASAPEVMRGMGYWLAYIHAPSGVTTTAATPYMSSAELIGVGFLLLLIALAALAVVRWRERALAASLILTGLVLSIGPHPIDDASPLMSGIASSTRSTLALSLRSSTRAIPLITMGAALCVAALVDAMARRRTRVRALVAPALTVLAIANMPALILRDLVEPELLHDQRPPAEWYDAAAVLDAGNPETRVLQLPGVESQVFEWGYTVDPPLAMLTDRPILTRDWLPLGSPAAMDLLYAFDDRFQNGTIDPAAIAPVARLLGVDTVWLALDANPVRFSSATPEAVAALLDLAPGISRGTQFGDRVRLYEIERAVPIARAATRTVVVFGSGDGVIDAAGAGLLDGSEALLYAADLSDDELTAVAATGATFLLTDSNRDRARQWRGAQDVWGFTETGGSDPDVLLLDPQDNRLPVFLNDAGRSASEQTTAHLEPILDVRATRYGSALGLRPEFRPAMAVDGDLDTAWIVGLDGMPIVGESIRVSGAPDGLLLRQVEGGHRISQIALHSADGRQVIDLDQRSLSPAGQAIDIDIDTDTDADSEITLTITAVELLSTAEDVGAGFSELLPSAHVEMVTTPSLRGDVAGSPFELVLTRLRTAKSDRSDPESMMHRRFDAPAIDRPEWRVQVSATSDVRSGCRSDLLELDGEPLPLLIDTPGAAALSAGRTTWLTTCTPTATMSAGRHTLRSSSTDVTGMAVNAVSLRAAPTSASTGRSQEPLVSIARNVDAHSISLSECPDGCWLVFGEGYSPGWSATADDATLDAHRSVSGGFNGWWVQPTSDDGVATVHLRWAAQRPVDIALWSSLLAGLACLMVVFTTRRTARRTTRWPSLHSEAPTFHQFATRDRSRDIVLLVGITMAVVSLTVSPKWSIVVLPIGILAVLARRRVVVTIAGVALVGLTAARFTLRVATNDFGANFAWPTYFYDLHRPMATGVIVLCCAALLQGLRQPRHTDE